LSQLLSELQIFFGTTLQEIIAISGLVCSVSSVAIALLSFRLSRQSFARDDGKIDFSISYNEVMNGQTFAKEGEVIHLKAINVGRRPVILSSIGGDKSGCITRLISKVTLDKLERTSVMFYGPSVGPLLIKNGSPATLHEGESAGVTLELPKFAALGDQICKDCKTLYLDDSMGRRHFVTEKVLKRFKKSWKRQKLGAKNGR
jgi:hypothetical protein